MEEDRGDVYLIDYRAACSLNNMGITLMEDSYFDQAVATLQDAVFVLKYFLQEQDSIRLTEDSPNPRSAHRGTNIAAKLDRACERIARRPTKASIDEGARDVIVWRYTTSNSAFPRELFASHTLIYIDDSDDVTSIRERDLKLEAAMILYNFALAEHFHSTSYSLTHCDRSVKLFSSAYEVLAEKGLASFGVGHSGSQARLLVGVLTLSQMLDIQRRIGQPEDALLPLQEQLIELNLAIEKMQEKSKASASRGTKTTAMAA
jgi:hypothetical protein